MMTGPSSSAWIEPSAEMTIISPHRPPQRGLATVSEDSSLKNLSFSGLDGSSTTLASSVSDIHQSPGRSPRSHLDQESTAKRALATPSPNKKGGVSFSTVRIHEHRLTLGDNPGVSLGVPLTLGWECDNSDTIDLEAFERLRCEDEAEEDTTTPRSPRRMCLMTRITIASENHSRDSILKRAEEVVEIQKSRVTSVHDRPEFMSQRDDCSRRRGTKVVTKEELAKQRKSLAKANKEQVAKDKLAHDQETREKKKMLDQEIKKKKKSVSGAVLKWFKPSDTSGHSNKHGHQSHRHQSGTNDHFAV